MRARRVALGTNAFPSLLRRLRPYVVPVYDYALMTEPLTRRAAGRDRLGAAGRASATPATSSTTTGSPHDNRDPLGRLRRGLPLRQRTAAALDAAAGDLRAARRALLRRRSRSWTALRFTHAWGGAIDTCTRFCAFFGTAYDGRVAYAAGYTGLGVGATRFGAQVVLDLLAGRRDRAHRGWSWCAASRCRSRPSRCAGPASS